VTARLRTDTGFTIVEVMVAIVILLVGVLGSVKLVDQAQLGSSATKARVGATNLARQLIDNARNMPYDSLRGTVDSSDVPSGPLTTAYKALPGLADAVPASASYQLIRRGTTYTVRTTACIIDDPKDGSRSDNSLAGLCPDSLQPAIPASPSADSNPDDFRRVQVQIWWDTRNRPHHGASDPGGDDCVNGTQCITETGLIPNPQLGPRITNVVPSPTGPAENPATGTVANPITFAITTTLADSVNWSIDDGHSSGQATNSSGGTSWTVTWTPGSTDCTTGLVDGPYTLSLQGIRNALPGNLFATQYTLNRCIPQAPTGLIGGRDTRIGAGGGASANGIADLQWTQNPERDIVGYRVYRVVGTPDSSIGVATGTTTGDDQLVGTFNNSVTGNTYPGCGPQVDGTPQTFCFDPQPAAAGSGQPSYYVVAIDRPAAADAGNGSTGNVDCPAYLTSTGGALPAGTKFTLAIDRSSGDPATADRYGCPSTILGPGTFGDSASRPSTSVFNGNPNLGTAPSSDSQLITWNLSGTGGGTGPIRFFRIYLDGTDYTNRIGRTGSGTDTQFVDQNAGNYSTGQHKYWVTAVDQNFQESDPVPSSGITFNVS
jgi:prepilin-type N-terminal cleavage/methylation domain-containing protein